MHGQCTMSIKASRPCDDRLAVDNADVTNRETKASLTKFSPKTMPGTVVRVTTRGISLKDPWWMLHLARKYRPNPSNLALKTMVKVGLTTRKRERYGSHCKSGYCRQTNTMCKQMVNASWTCHQWICHWSKQGQSMVDRLTPPLLHPPLPAAVAAFMQQPHETAAMAALVSVAKAVVLKDWLRCKQCTAPCLRRSGDLCGPHLTSQGNHTAT